MMQRYLKRREEFSTIGLPRTFLLALVDEVRRVFSPPYEVPLIMAFNVALVVAAWEFLPQGIRGVVFRYDDRHALPVALAVWMAATVASTNLIAPDPNRMLWSLDRPTVMSRMLRAKGLVVWMIIAVVVGAADLSIGFKGPDAGVAMVRTGILLCGPLATVGFGSWIGVFLPYKPIGVMERFTDLRERPRRTLRWLACLVLPYVVMPVLGWALMAPVLIFGLETHAGKRSTEQFDHFGMLLGALLVYAIVMFTIAYRVAVWLTMRRAPLIAELIIEPEKG